jgi:hypothetical protein
VYDAGTWSRYERATPPFAIDSTDVPDVCGRDGVQVSPAATAEGAPDDGHGTIAMAVTAMPATSTTRLLNPLRPVPIWPSSPGHR